jgi:hypothetical protein
MLFHGNSHLLKDTQRFRVFSPKRTLGDPMKVANGESQRTWPFSVFTRRRAVFRRLDLLYLYADFQFP